MSASVDATQRRAPTIRRQLLMLMRQEKSLARRMSALRAAGHCTGYVAAECSAVHWAIEELSRLYPIPADRARHDWRCEQERREVPRPEANR